MLSVGPFAARRTLQLHLLRAFLRKGFKCQVRLSEHVIKTTASRFGDDKKSAFIQKKLSGKLHEDFFGISQASEAKFASAGITNTDQLFAAFLSSAVEAPTDLPPSLLIGEGAGMSPY